MIFIRLAMTLRRTSISSLDIISLSLMMNNFEWVCVSEGICMKGCVSCLVYNVVRLMLFHYGCVSVRASV